MTRREGIFHAKKTYLTQKERKKEKIANIFDFPVFDQVLNCLELLGDDNMKEINLIFNKSYYNLNVIEQTELGIVDFANKNVLDFQ